MTEIKIVFDTKITDGILLDTVVLLQQAAQAAPASGFNADLMGKRNSLIATLSAYVAGTPLTLDDGDLATAKECVLSNNWQTASPFIYAFLISMK